MFRYFSLAFILSMSLLCPSFAKADPLVASYYGRHFNGRTMACGGIFHANDPSIVASKTLACGTTLWLTNPATRKVARATVQDRGPYVRGRDLDASQALARTLGYEQQGVAKLEVSYTDPSAIETVPAESWTPSDDMNIPVS